MNANSLARHYSCFTCEERFRLIMAASGRGDEAERERLVRSGEKLTLTMPDHAPYSLALSELSFLFYIELQEEAARFHDAFDSADEACARDDHQGEHDEGGDATGDESETGQGGSAGQEPEEDHSSNRRSGERFLDLAFATGYVLRTKAAGWDLFCARLTVPSRLLWEGLPGLDRLERALALAEKAAFAPEGWLGWLNRMRPQGEQPLTKVPLTAEQVADATEQAFRHRVAWWGG
jgi:hypothetical protein